MAKYPNMTVGEIAMPTAIYNGKKTVTTATAAEALATAQALVTGVMIKAETDNTGTVYVGNSTVAATNGYQLAAGESVFVAVANLATVYLDVSVNGDGVTYIGS